MDKTLEKKPFLLGTYLIAIVQKLEIGSQIPVS